MCNEEQSRLQTTCDLADNIPHEMKQYLQFVVWKFVERDDGKRTKIPFDPKNGLSASATNRNTWRTFDVARGALARGGYDGIGFVFTPNDPFAGIDLDDAEGNAPMQERQNAIYDRFDSYAELSPSGRGLHIIVRGSVPRGRRRSKVEVYSSERFFTMTGNVYRAAPIADHHLLLNALWHEMGTGKPDAIHSGGTVQTAEDGEIIRRALNGGSGAKFHALHVGRWREFYASQSEADFAYIDMLAYRSRNREQIARLFRASPLGARSKAQRSDYLDRMVSRSFDRVAPAVDISAIQTKLAEAIVAKRLGDAS